MNKDVFYADLGLNRATITQLDNGDLYCVIKTALGTQSFTIHNNKVDELIAALQAAKAVGDE